MSKVGVVTAKKLVAYCGGVSQVYTASKKELMQVPGIGDRLAKVITTQNFSKILDRAAQELKFIRKHRIQPLFYLDEGYPQRLKHCEDGPLLLYSRGEVNLNSDRLVSIVGTRMATDYGKEMCRKLVQELAPYNVTIVSGLAYGIDICAHRAALEYNIPTIGVLGHGLDRLYPEAHISTAKKMMQNGGVLTEFMSGTGPDRENFPKRNRIVAGMTDATIVIESGIKGGSTITAELAHSYHRDVFAVPGRLNDPMALGCNRLIKINKAALLESAKDIEYLMGWEPTTAKKVVIDVQLDPEETRIVQTLKTNGQLSIDRLSAQSKISASKASALLLNLEFKGVVKSLPGKLYALC